MPSFRSLIAVTPIAARAGLGLAAALLLPAPTAAQGGWQQIGTTTVGNAVFLNRASVKRAKGITTATLRVRLAKPGATPRGPITSTRTIVMFDCAKQTYAVKENFVYHDERANRVYDHKVIGIPGFGPPIKGGMPEIALAHLCRQ
jgi:hypothetical protein